jgi:signal transduction histidine kinase
VLNRKLGHFDQEDLEILEILGTQAGSVIENARLYDEARRASVINLIGDISHDVKNLLTPVVTGTQTLEMMMDSMFEDFDRAVSGVPPEQREALCWSVDGVRGFYKEAMEMTYDGAQDAQERVREIADAIKGIIAEPHFEDTDFRERAESVARVLRLVAERKGVLIDLSGLQDTGMVELDRKGIYNAIYNLINNAIPETPEGGKIMVRSRLIDFHGQPGLEIQVADTGHGMPPHVRARMFTESAISTKVGGTGLGTRIVKNVVDAHHGRIWVDSEEGKGTTFTIQLPARQPRGEGAPAAAQPV